MSGLALSARSVRVDLSGKTIVHDASIEVREGSVVALVGPNGAGKSTFVRAISGLVKPAVGEISCMGEPLSGLRGRRLARMRAYVPQRPRVPDGLTVLDAVRIGRSPHISPLGRAGRVDREAVEAAMHRAGVTGFRDRALTSLSGGEAQRVQIAVGLAQEAPLLIADEPTSQLDLGATVGVAGVLRALADDGLAVLLVVHDLALATAAADAVVAMKDGRTVAAGEPSEVLTPALLESVWGVDAQLERDGGGRTGLRVDWLGGLRRQQDETCNDEMSGAWQGNGKEPLAETERIR